MKYIGLIDCNNFFASCERLFRPDLSTHPIVILSGNDGCIVSRSNEAKELGIPMGEPYFKAREVIEKNKVAVFSGNFPLYSDISSRVTRVIKSYALELEKYSIDESFITITANNPAEALNLAEEIRDDVFKKIGVPVSVGFSSTKVLAKLATAKAKKSGGAFLIDETNRVDILTDTSTGAVWGIGRAIFEKMQQRNVLTALTLTEQNDIWIRKQFGLPLLKLTQELKGISSFSFHSNPDSRKMIQSTRSFGEACSDLESIKEALANHVNTAARKMRSEGNATTYLSIYFRTGRNDLKCAHRSGNVNFTIPTSDTLALTKAANTLAEAVFLPGYRYKKAGIGITGFTPIEHAPSETLFDKDTEKKRRALMKTLDAVNESFGKNSLKTAATGLSRTARWHSKNNLKSKPYTSDWSQIPRITI